MAINIEIRITGCLRKAALFHIDTVQSVAVLDGDVVGADADDGAVEGVEAVQVGGFGAVVGVVVEGEGG